MNRLALTTCLAFALPAVPLSRPLEAAESPRARGAVVELPPMMVEESVSSAPWYYVNVDGNEFLSRCSSGLTRDFVDAWLTRMQHLRVLVPAEIQPRLDVPAVFVLYTQDAKQTVSAEIQRSLQGGGDRARPGGEGRGSGYNVAPSMRLADLDMHASIAYIDEGLFDAAGLNIAPGHVRYLLRARLPELPAWLIEGVERMWQRVDFQIEPITIGPLLWINHLESDALAGDPARPRAVLPANELLAGDPARAAESRHPRRAQARASTQELFVRWGILSDAPTREAFWRFAARSADVPVTEEMFTSHFGFGFSELRDRLSDYLPEAVDETERISPGKLPPLPRFVVERATPNEIARVRGEWERLAIGYVRRRLPEVREPYIAQARRTLRRAFDAGDRDPRLLATMGLCEIDAGNEDGARVFLEPAVAAGVVRPRAYHELARLRFSELRRGAPPAASFTFTELAPILEVLRRGLAQHPALPESFILLAETWERCELSPTPAEFAELEAGARLFGRKPEVALALALALTRHGKNAEAAAVLDAGAGHATDDNTKAAITRLRAKLAAETARSPAAHPESRN